MAKYLAIVLLCLLSESNLAQVKPIYKNESIAFKIENGASVEKTMNFGLPKKVYDSIKNSSLFKSWKNETWSNPKNGTYLIDHKDWDPVILFLKDEVVASTAMLILVTLKNGASFDVIDGAKNSIYWSDNGIRISYTFKSQNDLGNYIMKKCIRSIDLKGNEIVSENYIY
jgi:hypothetical protein